MAKAEWERAAADRFIQHLFSTNGRKYVVDSEDVVVDEETGRNYDFRLIEVEGNERPIALEVFRLIDSLTDPGERAAWSQIVGLIQEELERSGAKGFLVKAPGFSIPRFRRQAFAVEEARKLVEAFTLIRADQETISVEGYEVTKLDGLGGVGFVRYPSASWVDSVGHALAAMQSMLPVKNSQLDAPGHRCVALMVRVGLPIDVDDVQRACTKVDFRAYPNVDEMYFEPSGGELYCVFERSVYNSFITSCPPTGSLPELYLSWLSIALDYQQPEAFTAARATAELFGPQVMPAPDRANLVRFGRSLVEQDEWDSVRWLLDNYVEDPDPTLIGDGEASPHERILANDDNLGIVSVRGHMAWLVEAIVSSHNRELLATTISITERYATGDDLYIRQQSAFPLTELTRRRFTSAAGTRPLTDDEADRIKALVLRLISDNARVPRVLDYAAHAVELLRDLNPGEFEATLDALIGADTKETGDAAANILIYYSYFRQQDDELHGPFPQAEGRARLASELNAGPPSLRVAILFQLWSLLRQDLLTIGAVLAELPREGTEPHDPQLVGRLYQIVGEHARTEGEALTAVLIGALQAEAIGIEGGGHQVMVVRRRWEAVAAVMPVFVETASRLCDAVISVCRAAGCRIPIAVAEGLVAVADPTQRQVITELMERR